MLLSENVHVFLVIFWCCYFIRPTYLWNQYPCMPKRKLARKRSTSYIKMLRHGDTLLILV